MTGPLRFEVLAESKSSGARAGRVTTPHGSFDTPAFMPVGTRGTVKGVLPHLVSACGAQVVLGNTFHLLLRPGPETVERLGGLHRFMGWPGPILTDSGGFQAFSMADINSVDDDGVTFRSIVDGSRVRLTPERAIEVQNQLGADIIMAFDDCPPGAAAGDTTRRNDAEEDSLRRLRVAEERTARWLERCAAAHRRSDQQALFGIVQGGTDLDLRATSARRVGGIDLPGYAIGGVAVGEPAAEIARVVAHTAPLLPRERPRYLMGVGYERDIVAAVRAGVDMFDCVLPTRNGRNANAFTRGGQVRLRNAEFAADPGPVEADCDCLCCRPEGHGWATPPFSRGYLRHLFMTGEMLGPILLSVHNLRYFQRLMSEIRRTVRDDDWRGLLSRWPMAAPDAPVETG